MAKKKTERGKKIIRKAVLVRTEYGEHLCEFITDPEGRGYTVIAKHLPGVVTQGRTMTEAKKMAKEALELCVECLTDGHVVRERRQRAARSAPLAIRV